MKHSLILRGTQMIITNIYVFFEESFSSQTHAAYAQKLGNIKESAMLPHKFVQIITHE